MADGSIVFSTALDNSDLEKGIKQAEADIEELKRKISEKTEERNALVEQLVEVKEQIIQAEKEQRDFNDLLDKGVDIAMKYNVAQAELDEYNAKLKEAEANQSRLANEYARTYQTSGAVFKESIAGVEARFNAFASKITKRMKKLFVFSFIFGALATFKSYLMSVIKEDERFSASVQNLVATLRGVAAPLISALIPPLTAIVNVLTAMITTLARLVDMVFHTDLVASINQARQAAQSSSAAADATNDQAKATDKLAKAQKKAAKWLAAFDELNVMQKEDSEDVTDSINSGLDDMGDDAGAGWVGMDLGKLDAALAEIMLILGAALLAVGAILAFSGINIPLGLTLMAIGALMVYTAYAEQWDKLPQELRDAINAALVITGIVLLVLGAILAFASPATTAIGIGMMAAGALMLWTAVAINWESMSAEMQHTVSVLMAILGGALLVIGAILTFTAANPALGVALMMLGAATLAGVVALNWESMPEEIQGVVTQILEIVGAAFLVLGMILVLASPTTAPLGVGLLLIGAASLASAVALQWDSMPQKTRDLVSVIGAIIGAALIVLGIFLIVTGVGLPLGIALILAGAGSIVAAVAVNFDAIRQKVAEIWQGLKEWFTSVVAPIFTVEWWRDKFDTITKSLKEMVDGALTTIGNTLKDIWDKLTDWFKTYIAPVFTFEWWADKFNTISKSLGEMLDGALTAIGDTLKGIWDKLTEWFRTYIAPVFTLEWWTDKFNAVGDALGKMLDGALTTVKETLGNIWDAVTSWFHDNVEPVFTIEFWGDLFKNIINSLIEMLNSGLGAFGNFAGGIFDGINGILDFFGLGGGWFNISMPSIPYLAQGAVIPPNRQFMAVLGDQSSGMNLEAPESLIRQIVREEAGMGNGEVVALLSQMLTALQARQTLECDGYTIAKVVNNRNYSNAKIYGY